MDPHAVTTVFDVARTLGSLASMVSAYVAVRREKREIGREEKRQILTAGEEGPRQMPIDDMAQLLSVIPKPILDAAHKRIIKAQKRYADIIHSPNTRPVELDYEYERAQEEVCALLKLIKRHNEGEMPIEELQDLWRSFNCGAN